MTKRRLPAPACASDEHSRRPSKALPSDRVLQVAATMFGAAGDLDRLRLLVQLAARPHTVIDLASVVDRAPSLVSQQLRVLRIARLVRGVRRGRFVQYELTDAHAYLIVESMIAHVEREQAR